MRFKLRFLLPLLLALVSATHAQTTDHADLNAKSSALDGALFYQLLLGELNARDEEPTAAFALILDAARKTSNPNLFRRAIHIALQVRSGESALLAAKAWGKSAPTSEEANRYVLQVLLGLNRVGDTLEPLKRQITLTPPSEQHEVMWSIPASYERASDRVLAANTVKKALAPWLADPALGPTAWAVVGRMSLSAGDKISALTAATNGSLQNPRAEHPALLALALMSSDLVAAESLVHKHLPHARPEFRLSYSRALLNAKRESDAKVQLQNLRNQNPNFPDVWLIEGTLALQEGTLDSAERQLQQYLNLSQVDATKPPKSEFRRGRTQAFLSMAQIAKQRKDFKLADDWLQQIDTPEDLVRAQMHRAAILAQQGQLEDAIALVRSQPERSAEDAQLKRSTEIQLLKENKQFSRARNLLQASLTGNPADHDVAYELAMVHEKLGELDEMERLLRGLMLAKPEDPHAYNALGYSLADRGLRLPEAKALIIRALQLAPQDPFIADSLAWAEFRSGNHEIALTLLQGAFKERPDAEIAAHMGEVLWVLKRQTQALDIWRQGMKLNSNNETLLETLKRLQINL